MPTDTYVIPSDDPTLVVYGAPIGFVTDALSGITWASYRGGFKIALDVPLCGQCDAPVEQCECEHRAANRRGREDKRRAA